MNIGLYGHSFTDWQRQQDFSYITLLQNHFNANIVNYGVPQSSEERMLFDLKKTKRLDLAILVHTSPDYHFVPSMHRDFDTLDRDSLISKIPNGQAKDWFKFHGFEDVPDDMCDFWEKIPNTPCYAILQDLDLTPEFWEDQVRSYKGDILDALINDDIETIRTAIKEKVKVQEEVEKYLGIFEAFRLHKKYMYHHDMQMNRYYGALIQIDMYLAAKKIPAVHILDKKQWIPNWFKFTSGVQTWDIKPYQHELNGYWVPSSESDNSMNEEGNRLVFEKLLPLIQQAQELVQ